MDFQEGAILLFNKPFGWSSFYLVNKVRYIICRSKELKKLKVGHAGTLDPLATGLLVVCTGKSTKKITGIQDMKKEYVAVLKLGATTPSFDLETEEDQIYPTRHISKEMVEKTLKDFLGEQQQIPPLFSAIKLKGKRAYEHARKGEDITLKSKQVNIYEIELISFGEKEIKLRILCSKGTYIRSLARDIGIALKSGAYLSELERTRIGNYRIEDAFTVENFEKQMACLD